MARQTGVIKFTGSLADLSGYKADGVHILRTKGGASAEQIANGENFARTRENMSEFSAISRVGKMIRDGFATTKGSWDRYVTGRLVKILKQVNLMDTTEKRGYRGVLITESKEKLLGFQFNKGSNVDSVIRVPYSVSVATDRDEATLSVPAMQPGSQLSFPSGATHARVIVALVAIADYVFNYDTSEYEPAAAGLETQNTVAYSGYLDLSAPITATTLVAALPTAGALDAAASLVVMIGVQFYQEVGGEYYPFSQGDALKIAQVA